MGVERYWSLLVELVNNKLEAGQECRESSERCTLCVGKGFGPGVCERRDWCWGVLGNWLRWTFGVPLLGVECDGICWMNFCVIDDGISGRTGCTGTCRQRVSIGGIQYDDAMVIELCILGFGFWVITPS